jgi:hypothetical protein
MNHEVVVLCDCNDIEHCKTEIYVSDVRILRAEYEARLDALWNVSKPKPTCSAYETTTSS